MSHEHHRAQLSHDENHWKEWRLRHTPRKPWDNDSVAEEVRGEKELVLEDEGVSSFLERTSNAQKTTVTHKKRF